MPADDGGRGDDDQGVLPSGPASGQPGPEQPVPRPQAGPRDGAPQDHKLLTQGQVLQDDPAACQQEQAEDAPDATKECHADGSIVTTDRVGSVATDQ
jgi:hypothetical protein